MIEIRNIEKSFSGQKILKDLTFTYEKGKTNLVIGQSGSGKTVLLKCLLSSIFNSLCFKDMLLFKA